MQYLGIDRSLFIALMASLSAAIVVMYLFRLRRRRVEVPYSRLWAQVLVEHRARSLWHRLKRVFSLLVWLLVLLLLLLALRDPRPAELETEGRHVLILVDTSASMAARDVPSATDRMEAARQEALAVIDTLEPRDQVMVALMEDPVRPLTPFERPAEWLREQVAELSFTATRSDLLSALSFAASSLQPFSRAELVIITDGAFGAGMIEAARSIELPRNARVRLVQLGTATGNLAITAFNVRRYMANRLNYEVFVELTQTFDVPVTVELTLSANGRQVHRVPVDIPAGGSVARTFTNLATGGHRLEARIEVTAGDVTDVFPLDDTAYALLPQDRRTRVMLVSQDNLFAEAPFLLNQNIELTRVSPTAYAGLLQRAAAGAYDVTVFDDVSPPVPAEGRFLYFHPTGEHSPWTGRGEVANPIIDRFERDDPLMRWLHGFRSVNIRRASRLVLTSQDQAVARSIEGDAMFVRRDEGPRRLVAVAFALEESDFPLRVAYPIFVLNALDWLTDDPGSMVAGLTTGQAWRQSLGPGAAGNVRVAPPVGDPFELPIADGKVTLVPSQPGFYRLEWEEGSGSVDTGSSALEPSEDLTLGTADGSAFDPFGDPAPGTAEHPSPATAGNPAPATMTLAVNFSDIQESDIAVADLSPLGMEMGFEPPQVPALPGGQDPWFYLVLGALAIITLEWVTYHRRMTE